MMSLQNLVNSATMMIANELGYAKANLICAENAGILYCAGENNHVYMVALLHTPIGDDFAVVSIEIDTLVDYIKRIAPVDVDVVKIAGLPIFELMIYEY